MSPNPSELVSRATPDGGTLPELDQFVLHHSREARRWWPWQRFLRKLRPQRDEALPVVHVRVNRSQESDHIDYEMTDKDGRVVTGFPTNAPWPGWEHVTLAVGPEENRVRIGGGDGSEPESD
jgi:hypothetical protein